MTMRTGSVLSLGPHDWHRVAYTDWGDPDNCRVVVCAHGLTRNGRDFDYLAKALAADYRVICPDVPGRGVSDWLEVKEDYGYPLYCSSMAALIAHLRAEQVDWIGTSMGGLIGMMLAYQSKTPIRRLIVNDVGPFIPKAALERIGAYVGSSPRFASIDEVEAYMRQIYASFGALSNEQWRHIAVHSVAESGGEGYLRNYDPAIAAPFQSGPIEDVDLWPVWDNISCPTLILRGADSDLLLAETAREMVERGPRRAQFIEFPGVGHAPPLMSEEQIGVIRDWLLADG